MSSNDDYKGFVFSQEDIAQLKIKPNEDKDIYFLCLSEDENESLSYSLTIINRFSKCGENIQKKIHVLLFSKYNDYSLFIDSTEKGLLDIQCITEAEIYIYNLLLKYPMLKYASSKIHALLYGFTSINVAALKAICWCGQIDGIELEISVIGKHIKDEIDNLKASVPGVFSERYKVNFFDCDNKLQIAETIKEKCKDVNYIIVSEETDNETLEASVELRRLLYKMDESKAYSPPIFCYIKDPSKHLVTSNLSTAEMNPSRKVNYGLIPFGGIQEVYSYKNLYDTVIEKISKNVHLAYEEIFSSGSIDVNDALKRYNLFEVNKRSNRANALHIKYKLNLLGLDFIESSEEDEVLLDEFINDDILHKLAISEHNRWMAFLETEGWVTASEKDVGAYKKSGISGGRHNCPLLKMHPYICEYEKLRELSIKLEGRDTTFYDEELIRKIPDILGDKWNISGRKYKIIKIKKQEGI